MRSGEAKLESDDESLGRTQSLAASLNYRLDHLSPDLRGKLSLLCLFQGFVSAGVLAAICRDEGVPPAIRDLARQAWEDMLESARDVGLLSRVGPGLYKIHPALPWFFREAMEHAFPDHRENLERAFIRLNNLSCVTRDNHSGSIVSKIETITLATVGEECSRSVGNN